MTQHLDIALEAELSHRRTALQQDARHHQLTRLVANAARAAAARVGTARTATPATAPATTPAAARTHAHA